MLSGNKRYIIVVAIVAALAAVLVGFESIIEIKGNKARAYDTSAVIIEQVKEVIAAEENKSSVLVESLKEDYITRAKAVSYTIDHNPELENDVDELIKIADLMSVDEIHLFDQTGTIYGGTTPQYYGYSFDSGDQMAYFKPMLSDHTLVMCQDITPNTAEGKEIMYAICWNNDKTRMVQVGIEPLRLIEEMHASQISELIRNMTSYNGVDVLVAEKSTQLIIGDSKDESLGRSLSDIGLDLPGSFDENVSNFECSIDGDIKYCSGCESNAYIIAVLQDAGTVNHSVPMSAFLLSVYIIVGAVIVLKVIKRLNKNIMAEKEAACTDELTGIGNRRSYETALTELSGLEQSAKKDIVYCSMDLNGLKHINDTLGHAEGDRLIKGAAFCIKKSFSDHGKVFRIGGDEFAAIIVSDKEVLDAIIAGFRQDQAKWSAENKLDLSISLGYATFADHQDMLLSELLKHADEEMYKDKKRFYSERGNDRRRR